MAAQGNTVPAMVTRIGKRRPFQLFIKEWIEHKTLDQDQVAARIGCSPGTLSKLISGKMRRTDEWLAAIAYALGDDVDVTDLFRHPKTPRPEDLLKGLPEDERERVIRMINAYKSTGTDG